jgi:EAL domain-containing protein (putative c-di-GMP-specific phosphodiesterase class I)
MHEDRAAFGMVQTVLGFAQTLGARVVAEGIETPEQWADLRDLGCDYGQGYHFARPLSAEAMEGLLRDGAPWAIGTAADSA